MPCRHPAEIRQQVIELARSGTKVAQLAATIYNWLKPDKVDCGEIAGLSTEEAAAEHDAIQMESLSSGVGLGRWGVWRDYAVGLSQTKSRRPSGSFMVWIL